MLLLARLRFRSGLRIGEDSLLNDPFQGTVHSDTIFSALMNEWARLYPDDSIDYFITTLSFRVSSAFPFDLSEYYLPTPMGTGPLYMAKLKDMPFLELYDFIALADGNHKAFTRKELKNPVEDLMFNRVVPRVTIDRISATTNIFGASEWVFKEGSGLYFLVDLRDETLKDKLVLCIRMLGDSGLGGDRSVGCGLFDAEVQEASDSVWAELFKKRETGKAVYCTLSLCHATKEDAMTAISYRLLTRRGWIFSHSSTVQMKRRACKMFAEGSLFSMPVVGSIVHVTPSEFKDHRVYRYGVGMMVEMRQADGQSAYR